jgi:hypothetical protein
MPTETAGARPKRRWRRVLWLAIILAAMALYFPINLLVHGGVQLSSPLDQFIPLYPVFIIPYLSGSLLFIGLPVWAAFSARSGEFEFYLVCILLATAISYIVYLTYPTYVVRPEVISQDLFSNAISLLYRTDRAYNAAPSGHAFYSTLSLIFLIRWKPDFRIVWLAFWLLILTATLFTRQHNLLDLVGGLALAGASYAAGRVLAQKRELKFAS